MDLSEHLTDPSIAKANGYQNDFPALDFKFHNPGTRPELITAVELELLSLTPDYRPAIEYSLTCRDGDLLANLYNFGWGPALNFSLNVDLSQLGKALGGRSEAILTSSEIPEATIGEQGRFEGVEFVLVRGQEVHQEALPAAFTPPLLITTSSRDWEVQRAISSGGIPAFPGIATFEDVIGTSYKEMPSIGRVQRGAYDWRTIYLTEGGFNYVPYDGGVRYSLVQPSCTYNFLIDPQKSEEKYEISIAHEVPAGGFERIWVVIGATMSLACLLTIQFRTNRRRTIKSSKIAVQIWNQRNTFFSLRGGSLTRSVSAPHGDPRKYDLTEMRKHTTKSWGY